MASHRAAGQSPGGPRGAAEATGDDRPAVPRARDGRHDEPAADRSPAPAGPVPPGGGTGPPRLSARLRRWAEQLRAASRALPRRGRVRWTAAAVVLAVLPALIVVLLTGDDERPGLEADYVTTGTGAQYILHNTGQDTVHGWTLRFRLPPGAEVTDVWNGRAEDEGGGRWVVRGQEWNSSLRPGAYVVVGVATGTRTGSAPLPAPADCTINDHPCRIPRPGTRPAAAPGAAATPTAVPPGAPAGTSRTAAPPVTAPAGGVTARPSANAGTVVVPPTVPAPSGGRGARAVPYLDLSVPPTAGGLLGDSRARTLAFVVDGGECRPMWGGVTRPDDEVVIDRVAALRAAGADLGVAFGGTAGTDLALTCGTPEQLADAYGQVLTAYGAARIDLYVSGSSLARPDVVERRNQALRVLRDDRAARGLPLEITYSVPVTPKGLGADARDLLAGAARAGLQVRHVNLLALDFGQAAAPEPEGAMGLYASQAAMNAFTQLRELWPTLTPDQLWGRMQVTVMIGRNDVPGETFTPEDARQLVAFAEDRHLGRIGWWSEQRDRPCPPGTADGAGPACSSVDEEPGTYARILGAYGG